tara:strand:- start:4301 stop:5284 length:984 start_codon:yes stop_codon:yes gene_type:complete
MILKHYVLSKKNIEKKKYFLLYGKNKGLVEETIKNILKPSLPKNIFKYEENEILNNTEIFYENIRNQSFFENQKLVIIQRASDKIFKIITELIEDDPKDIAIILIADLLEKKSKLRNFFEKAEETVCIPFYEETNQSLNIVVQNFLKEKKIKLSQQNINVLVERSRGDRINLNNELMKIQNLLRSKKQINIEEILELTNLAENYLVSELVDSSLIKNKTKTINILNENNFNSEDCIIIVRTYLSKLKRLLKIKSEQLRNKDLESAISTYKPPIFWKDKEIVKEQARKWDYKKIQDLIMKTNKIEFELKKNPSSSPIIVMNFIHESVA